jgi:transposase-like protein
MPGEHRKSRKTQLALALVQGVSVAAWARANGVPKSTVYRWAREPDVLTTVKSCRRRASDRAVGTMARRATWAAEAITWLANSADSESVKLRALRAILADLMAVSKYTELEDRIARIEEQLPERAGSSDRTG